MLLSSKELTMKLNHLNSLPYFFPYFGKGSCTNHVDSKGGGGVGQMSTFVYVGGRGVGIMSTWSFSPIILRDNF